MKSYFISVIIIAFFGSAAVSFAPGGGARYLKLLCGACTAGCLILPIASFLRGDLRGYMEKAEGWINEFEFAESGGNYYDEIYNNTLNDASIENIKESLKRSISKEFLLNEGDIDISISTNENSDENYIYCTTVTLRGSAVATDPYRVREYVESRLGCECVIYYE